MQSYLDWGIHVIEGLRQQQPDAASDSPKSLDKTDPVFGQIMDMSELAVVIFDEALNLKYYNANAIKYFELSLKDFDQNFSYENITETLASSNESNSLDQDFMKNFIHQTFDENESTTETKLTTKSGRYLTVKRKRSEKFHIITALDITQAHLHKHTLSIALESGRAGYFNYNCESKAFEIFSDYLRKQLTEKLMKQADEEGLLSIVHPSDKEATQISWDNALKTGQGFDRVSRIVTGKGRNIWMRWHVRPQTTKDGRLIGFNCFFEDVTKELEVREALRQSKEIAEKSLKVKNDFLARLAHEIRTPMNGVIGIADALIHHHSDETINPKLELIQSSADKILRIVDETLNHTKLHADKLTLDSKPSSPAQSVEDVVNLWEQKALQNNIKLSFIIAPTVPEEITFDKFRYEQCMNNLISNAVKFTPNGNIKVMLTTQQKEGGKPRLIFAVQDNGIGMSKDQQNQIFEAYTQGDKSIAGRFGGTGLGMTITKEIIELMGGSISVRSELGKGSVFILSLPYNKDSEDSFEEDCNHLVEQLLDEAKPEPTNYSKLKVLVADDNATNHMVVMSLIESLVAEVHLASDGQEALDILKTTDIDIILMDIHMPVMDGIEATLSIRSSEESWSDVSIIALTADPQYQQKRLCKNIGMDEALAKPVKLSDILEAFDNVLKIDHSAELAA